MHLRFEGFCRLAVEAALRPVLVYQVFTSISAVRLTGRNVLRTFGYGCNPSFDFTISCPV